VRYEHQEEEDLTKRDTASEDLRVLVGLMNNLRDLEIARDQGWYRIPLESAPSRVGADYLAFYQTKAFGEERWAINYYAAIRHFRIVSRQALLPEEPDHTRANELYYKIEIGPLQRLPHPIPSHRLRRITFIPTTLNRLLRAEEINDLWCGSAAEEKLWQAFKENGITAERYYSLKEEDEAYQIDFALFCKGGRIAVLLEGEAPVENIRIVREQPRIDDYDLTAGGWSVLRFTDNQLTTSVTACLDTIVTAVTQRGGLLHPPTATNL
jgi:very-short-patch-repair endonuclease